MSDEGLDIRGPWDLVVVGHGFAGLSAAVAFLESWPGTAPRVAVIHRGVPGERGGSTGESSAIFRLTDTGDLPEGVAERIGASAGAAVDEGYLQDFAAQLPATLAWLQSNGVEHQPAKGIVVPGSTGDWNLIVGGGAHFIETYAQRGINFGARFFAQVELVGLEREP
ncbi:MAG: FAD-binding protein, partial [Microbacterium sp.]